MTERTSCKRLKVATELFEFVEREALPGTGVTSDAFWAGFDAVVHDLTPRNRELLEHRDRLQAKLDTWYRSNPGPIADMAAYQAFLREIGYLTDAPDSVAIKTENVDTEISAQAGPQLVVPITNARYALNAANARWGSLYDALYGTDAISEDGGATRAGSYNPARGEKVIAFARKFLDDSIPLATGSHADATAYVVSNNALQVTLADGSTTKLAQPELFLGYRGEPTAPEALVFRHHGLHFEVQIDKSSAIGKQDKAGVKDVRSERAHV